MRVWVRPFSALHYAWDITVGCPVLIIEALISKFGICSFRLIIYSSVSLCYLRQVGLISNRASMEIQDVWHPVGLQREAKQHNGTEILQWWAVLEQLVSACILFWEYSFLLFFLQIISSASPCADFFFQSLSSEFKRIHMQSHTHASQRAVKQSFDETVRLIQRCSEVDLNIVVLWKVCMVVVFVVIWQWNMTVRK